MFGATNVLKNSDKAKWVYFGYGIALDQADLWNFGNGFSRNIVIFGVNDSSSSHSVKVLGEGPTSGINSSFSSPQRKFSINFTDANTKFCLSSHDNHVNSYLFVNGKEIF